MAERVMLTQTDENPQILKYYVRENLVFASYLQHLFKNWDGVKWEVTELFF